MDTNGRDPWDKYLMEVVEVAALMAEAGQALVLSLDDPHHDEQAACALLGAIFELEAVEQRYELEWLFRQPPGAAL